MALHEYELLTPCSSYATLEKPEACLMGGCLVLGPGWFGFRFLAATGRAQIDGEDGLTNLMGKGAENG